MVMKDKIVKTNHKRGYYLTKKISIASFVMTASFFACFIPTYIAVNKANVNEQVKAEDVEDNKETKEEELMSFIDCSL